VFSKAARLAAFGLLALVATASAKDQFPLELTVKTADGKPAEGVAITVTVASGDPFTISGATDKKGRFDVELPDFARVYNVAVSKAGFGGYERPLDFAAQGIKTGQTAEVALTIAPRTHIDAYNEGARALADGNRDLAIERIEESTRMKTDFVEAWRALSGLYAAATRPAEALLASDRTLELAAGDVEALRNRYDALVALGRGDDAKAALAALVAVDRTPETARLVFNLGADAMKAGDHAGARGHFLSALELDPNLYQAHSALAEIQIGAKDFAGAVAELDKVLLLSPRNFVAWERKVEVLRAMGKADEAAEVQRKLVELRGN
jgi:tetratricopeptide (TPR) repeat protein